MESENVQITGHLGSDRCLIPGRQMEGAKEVEVLQITQPVGDGTGPETGAPNSRSIF